MRTEKQAAANQRKIIHGLADSPTRSSWTEMKRRCYAKHRKEYPNYGGRGIEVCPRWLESFSNFLEDMGVRPDGHTLERRDNDGNYAPENCLWSRRADQERNKRSNHVISVHGEQMPIIAAAERFGIKPATLYNRIINLKWPPERAVFEAIRRR